MQRAVVGVIYNHTRQFKTHDYLKQHKGMIKVCSRALNLFIYHLYTSDILEQVVIHLNASKIDMISLSQGPHLQILMNYNKDMDK